MYVTERAEMYGMSVGARANRTLYALTESHIRSSPSKLGQPATT